MLLNLAYSYLIINISLIASLILKTVVFFLNFPALSYPISRISLTRNFNISVLEIEILIELSRSY